MRKIESLFIGISLIAIIATIGGQLHHLNNTNAGGQHAYNFPSSKYGNFLAAQHAIYINDFVAASDFTANLADVDYPIVQNTRLISEFLGGKLPENAHLLKNEKSMPAQLIYDAYLVLRANGRNYTIDIKQTSLHWPHHCAYGPQSQMIGAPIRLILSMTYQPTNHGNRLYAGKYTPN